MKEEFISIFIVILIASSFSNGLGQVQDNLRDCRIVQGEVTGKDMSDGMPKLFARVEDGFEERNVMVYVSPKTFQNYNVGDTYYEKICDYVAFRDFVDELLESGVLINQ